MTPEAYRQMQEKHREIVLVAFPHATGIWPADTETLHFEIEHDYLSFEGLEKLSQAFKTKLINFCVGDVRQGCESCGHGATAIIQVDVKGIGMLK